MSDPLSKAHRRVESERGTFAGFLIRLRIALFDNRFPLAAFLIPLVIRTIPEIIAGPYPIGYDTIASYVPLMRDWAAGKTVPQFTPAIGGWLNFPVFRLTHGATGVASAIIAN